MFVSFRFRGVWGGKAELCGAFFCLDGVWGVRSVV
jgi:hypothetical protein